MLYIRDIKLSPAYLYLAVSDDEYQKIAGHQFRVIPKRFFNKKYLCPTFNKIYAQRVANEKANWNKTVRQVHVIRMLVALEKIMPHINGSIDNANARIAIPGTELDLFNKQIIGYIEKLETIDHYANELALT